MEILPEQDSPLSSFLQTAPPIMSPLAIPPIQHEPPLRQQIWPGTSSDSDWGTRALEALLHLSDLASIVLGVKGYQTSPPGPQTSSLIPLLSSTSSVTTSISPTLPSFPVVETPIEPMRQTGSHPSTTEQRLPTLIIPSFAGMSLYRSPSNLPLPQGQHETRCLSSNPEELHHDEQRSSFPGKGGSHQEVPSMSKDSINMIATGDEWRQSKQWLSERSTSNSPMLGSIVEERWYTTPTIIPGQRYSRPKNRSTASLEGRVPLPLSSPYQQS